MSIFNSLGSNYSTSFVLRNVFSLGSTKTEQLLVSTLAEHYGGQVTLTYKGREALELGLKELSLKPGSAVAICGFTCYVVYRAVVRAGYTPVFVDINKNQLNFGVESLSAAHKKHSISAVIVQNTLGYPADMKGITDFCSKQRIIIIEDLAHSLGAVYETGQEAGTVGEITMLSFSQDKTLDVVAGGALVNRQSKAPKTSQRLPAGWLNRQRNRWYPFWTWLIRSTYSAYFGRLIHHGLKRLKLMANPMSDAGEGIHRLDKRAVKGLLTKWSARSDELSHRKQIANIYESSIPESMQLVKTSYGQAAYLRFPLYIRDRESLIAHLKQYKVYIGDTWYDAPIAPSRYQAKTSYKLGQCPNAEDVSKHIVNLPTHRLVTETQAKMIAERVTEWVKSQ